MKRRWALIDLTSGGEISRHSTQELAEAKVKRIVIAHERRNLFIWDTRLSWEEACVAWVNRVCQEELARLLAK